MTFRSSPPGVLLILLVCTGCVTPGSSEADSGSQGLFNRRLELDVEVNDAITSYRARARFDYRIRGTLEDGLYFVFPGIESHRDLMVVLDGHPLDHGELSMVPHPLYEGFEVFRFLDGSTAASPGDHTLEVSGPWLENDGPDFTRWGGWHPYLGDRAVPTTIEMTATAPAASRIVASGRRVAEAIEDGVRTSTWQSRSPQGWSFLAVGDYADTILVGEGAPFQVWMPLELRGLDLSSIVSEPGSVLRYLEGRLGNAGVDTVRWIFIPREELTNFSVDGLLVGSKATAIRVVDSPTYLRGFLAHEMAHYWFGGVIQSPPEGARWMSEAFAEYWRYRYEESVGAEPLSWSFRNQLVLRRFLQGGMPSLLERAPDAPDELYYQKGAFVLYMLEQHVGRALMDETMKSFVQRYRSRSAHPDQFFSVAEEVADRDLEWFSDQWLKRPRGPLLELGEATVRRMGGGYEVEAVVEQQEPPYRLELPVEIETRDGETHRFLRSLEEARHTFTFEVGEEPVRITLDPESRIFKWFSAEQLPLDFALFRKSLMDDGRFYIKGPGSSQETGPEWNGLRQWLAAQFGEERIVSDSSAATHIIALGQSAAEIREAAAPGLPEPPDGVLQAYVRWEPANSTRMVVGIEGRVPEAVPPIIPEGPYSYIAFRDGNVVGAHGTGTPRVTKELGEALPQRR